MISTEHQEPRNSLTRATRRGIARLLRFPMFYKVLIANSLLVTLGAVAGTTITLRLNQEIPSNGGWLSVGFALAGISLTIVVNMIILRAAFQPVRSLRETVGALGRGDFEARVPESPLADADLHHVAMTLNEMIDHVQRYQERVHDLSASVLQAQEGERHRIARELHDQIGQALTFLLVRLKIIEALPSAEPIGGELAELRAGVAATIDQVRRLALALRPPALDQLGLIPALRALAREFAEQTRVSVTFEPIETTIDVHIDRATAVYRIIQEALTNVAKHAEAHHVRIILVHRGDDIVVQIADDGCGFDMHVLRREDRVDDGPGLGLFGMEERARLLGGTYSLASLPGKGTTITATIPINPLEHPHGTAQLDTDREPANIHLIG